MTNIPGAETLLSSFPPSLAVDTDKYALAKTVAEELSKLIGDCNKLLIYSRIDELDETLLDILAFDFNVSWYWYNGTIETKRDQIKSCFYVHRHLGTKSALVTAISALCPGSDVEEWFEYGGEPYYFRIVIDVTNQRLPIVQSEIKRYIKIFKPLRSLLEGNNVIYKSAIGLEISVNCCSYIYSSPRSTEATAARAGIYPEKTLLITRSSGGEEYQ